MKRALALLLCTTMLTPGCAASRLSVAAPAAAAENEIQRPADPAAVAAFARQLPIGSRVRLTYGARRTMRGTLMKADDRSITIQPRTRIMEAAVEVPLDQIAGIDVEQPGGIGKAVAIGVGTGAAAALGVFLLLIAATFSD